MGFDIYGVNPTIKDGSIKPTRPESDYTDNEAWNNYFELTKEFEEQNPGVYFRANVWYWRPIAQFLINTMDFLDDKDCDGLSYNDGHTIDDKKAKQIAKRIFDLDDIGAIEEWVHNEKVKILMLDNEDCEICYATGVREIEPMLGHLEKVEKNGITGYKCNACDGEGTKKPFISNYPYSRDVIIEFGIFAKESGGFQIC